MTKLKCEPLLVLLYFVSSKINLLIQSEPKFYRLYVVPFVAILGLFWFSKNMPKLPVITFIGRYSIVVLGTHILMIKFMMRLAEMVSSLIVSLSLIRRVRSLMKSSNDW